MDLENLKNKFKMKGEKDDAEEHCRRLEGIDTIRNMTY